MVARPTSLGAAAKRIFSLENELTPLALGSGTTVQGVIICTEAVTTDHIRQDLHPVLFIACVIGIKVDNLAIIESDAEALLNKHVALLFLRKCGAATLSILAGSLLLSQRATIVDEPLRIGEINGGTGLARGLMVGRQLCADKLEIAATPVLWS